MASSGYNRRRLVLHFDLNSTILMLDTACGQNVTQTVSLKKPYFLSVFHNKYTSILN